MTLDRTIAHATPLDNADLIDAWLAAIPVDANRQRVSDLLNETLRTHPNLVLVWLVHRELECLGQAPGPGLRGSDP